MSHLHPLTAPSLVSLHREQLLAEGDRSRLAAALRRRRRAARRAETEQVARPHVRGGVATIPGLAS